MQFEFDDFTIYPIQEKDAWRICDFVTINTERLKTYFPLTLAANQTPDLANYFAIKKQKQFVNNEEYVFVLKEHINRTIIGIIFIKELDWKLGQGEFAYAINYARTGKGYISKSIIRLTEWAFSKGLNTLQIIVNKENKPSIKVADNCGFTWQKTLLKEFTPPGKNAMDMELYERYS